MTIEISSPAFEAGKPIPAQYTGDGENLSPPLEWKSLPGETKSVALICDDPDAPMGTWVHWVLYCLSPAQSSLEEGIPAKEELPGGARQGKNDFRNIGYGGPAPPPGKPHHYVFKVYALDAEPDLKPGATKKDLLNAMEGHVLAQGRLVGTYNR
jgi:Raf kinase inhibitor-like YbhB/YbcL family protein